MVVQDSDPVRASRKGEFILALSLALLVAWLGQTVVDADFAYGFNQSFNNRNVSVDTRVNITGSAPEILLVTLPNPITLAAGSLQVVTCNVSVRDYNGFSDIINVNATFFHTAQSTFEAADDNNTHYTNNSCAEIGGQEGGYFKNYTCSFGVSYYAVNGTWNCTAFVNDSINLINNGTNTTNIGALLALNVTPLIDYGNLAVGSTSTNQTANVSNLGNLPINVTVRGYGATFDDGLSFVCEVGNVSLGAQRFSANISAEYAAKTTLASAYQQVPGFAVSKPFNDSGQLNATYWQLYLAISESALGLCNGTVVFQAESQT